MLVMSFAIAYTGGFISTIVAMPVALLVIAPAFVFHEMGHKLAAQHYHYWAEYRMWIQGLMFAILIAVVTTHLGAKMIFIAPGAVYFTARAGHIGSKSMEKYGKIGLAGPLVNLGLASVFGLVAIFATSPFVQYIGYTGTYVNSFLAIFNLIPFAPLDGQKIISWDKRIWGFVMGLAVIAFLASSSMPI